MKCLLIFISKYSVPLLVFWHLTVPPAALEIVKLSVNANKNEGDKTIIYPEYDQIGISINEFSYNGIKKSA